MHNIYETRLYSTGIPTLFCNGKKFNTAKNKASVLNNHFQSIFTSEHLSNIPSYYNSSISSMSPIININMVMHIPTLSTVSIHSTIYYNIPFYMQPCLIL